MNKENHLKSMKILLSVVDSDYLSNNWAEEIAKDKSLLKSVIKLAERNGLYYYFIYRLKELGIDLSLSEEEHWKRENQRLLKLKNTISLINKISTDYEIGYIVIKACNTIPHVPRDIDIFIRSDDRVKIIKAFKENGMKCVQKGVSETALEGDNFIRTDIYTEICYVGVNFLDKDFLFQSKVENEIFGLKYFGLSNEADLLLMLVHTLFGHRSISLLDFLHINRLRENVDINVCRKYASERGWEMVFDLVLDELDNIFEKINRSAEVVNFPYLFNSNFILKSISQIKGLHLKNYDKIRIHITLAQDRVIYELKDTPIYNLLKSINPVRNLVNSLTAWFKGRRGDRKSSSSREVLGSK